MKKKSKPDLITGNVANIFHPSIIQERLNECFVRFGKTSFFYALNGINVNENFYCQLIVIDPETGQEVLIKINAIEKESKIKIQYL